MTFLHKVQGLCPFPEDNPASNEVVIRGHDGPPFPLQEQQGPVGLTELGYGLQANATPTPSPKRSPPSQGLDVFTF